MTTRFRYDHFHTPLILNRAFFISNVPHEVKKGEHCIEILMRNLLVSRLCGTKSELATYQDLAVAHRLVSRLESIPKRIGRERHNIDILTYEV
jgi:hypothetical protein